MLENLNAEFAIEGKLQFVEHSSGLIQGLVTSPECTASFFLLGAHVAEFQPSGCEPVLFMSQKAVFEEGKAIRGGIPICFPWFGPAKHDADAPSHGLVRTELWSVTKASAREGSVEVSLQIEADDFLLDYELRFGKDLQATFRIKNQATARRSCDLALHSYFAIGNVDSTQVQGLENHGYLDQLTGEEHLASGEPIQFTEETDRIYHGSCRQVRIVDSKNERTLVVEAQNSQSTVVWNPWVAKSQRMPDFGDLEYPHMCCVETANIRPDGITLDSGSETEVNLCISVE